MFVQRPPPPRSGLSYLIHYTLFVRPNYSAQSSLRADLTTDTAAYEWFAVMHDLFLVRQIVVLKLNRTECRWIKMIW